MSGVAEYERKKWGHYHKRDLKVAIDTLKEAGVEVANIEIEIEGPRLKITARPGELGERGKPVTSFKKAKF